MTLSIRPAELRDIDRLTQLFLADAEQRHAARPGLWRLDGDAGAKTSATLRAAMQAEKPPFRQQWLVAETPEGIVGATHSILLPVPPIYAGAFGPPGLIMEDCCLAPEAPAATRADLLRAAEADLTEAGARILLASSIEGGPWQATLAAQGYRPLTMYLAKTGLTADSASGPHRPATKQDVPGIVASSATHRRILNALNSFWEPHEDADTRFGGWMARSLTLSDRDMFVSETSGSLGGYAISQPATPLHFPTPHDIRGIGVIDDFYHDALEDPQSLGAGAAEAVALFQAAEAARAGRGNHSVLVVCPAAWQSKIDLLERAGYSNAITWHIRTRA